MEYPKSIILGEGFEKIPHGVSFISCSYVLLKFLHNLGFVVQRQCWGIENDSELRVVFEYLSKGS